MKREWFQGANLFGLCVIMALFGWKCGQDDPKPAPVAVKLIEAPPFTGKDVQLQSTLDIANDKRRTVMFRSINAPHVTLYDTYATHKGCNLNGKPMQVAQIGENAFTCYRWINRDSDVAILLDHDKYSIMPGRTFKAQ